MLDLAFSGALALLALVGQSSEPAADSEPVEPDDTKAQAARAVIAARTAAADGDYPRALEHFERALQLRPTPALHYNIAVCHHRIMLDQAEGTAEHEAARAAAVEAYNRYLQAAPDAADRDAVSQTVFSLGGRPKTLDEWTIEPDKAPGPSALPQLRESPRSEAEDSELDEPETAPKLPDAEEPVPQPPPDRSPPAEPTQPQPEKPPPLEFPRGRVGVGLYLGIVNIGRLQGSDQVEGLPALGGVFRAGAFAGRRKHVNIGGELGVHGQPTGTDSRHFQTGGYLAATAEYAHRLGPAQRLEVGAGGLLGVVRDVLRHRTGSATTCPSNDDGIVSDRGGLLLGGRFILSGLLGAKRRHELSLRITPALALFAAGTRGDGQQAEDGMTEGSPCNRDLTPFKELGLDGPALVMTVDLGYAPRF